MISVLQKEANRMIYGSNTAGAMRHMLDILRDSGSRETRRSIGKSKQPVVWQMDFSSYSYPEQPPARYSAPLGSNQPLPSFPATCREGGTGRWLRRDWRLKQATVPQTISQETELRDHHWLTVWCRNHVCAHAHTHTLFKVKLKFYSNLFIITWFQRQLRNEAPLRNEPPAGLVRVSWAEETSPCKVL